MDTDPTNQTSKSNKELLREAIEACLDRLRTGVQVIVARAGIVEGKVAINEMADDILQMTVETSLRIADRYNPALNTHAWLLTIATNIVKDSRKRVFKEASRSANIQDMELKSTSKPGDDQELDMTEDERLDALFYERRMMARVEPDHELERILGLVNDSDRKILSLTYVHDMSGREAASELGISEPAALMRLSRARKHLADAYFKRSEMTREE